jgi:hypothetical protein
MLNLLIISYFAVVNATAYFLMFWDQIAAWSKQSAIVKRVIDLQATVNVSSIYKRS